MSGYNHHRSRVSLSHRYWLRTRRSSSLHLLGSAIVGGVTTAVAILRCVQRCVLHLDWDVSKGKDFNDLPVVAVPPKGNDGVFVWVHCYFPRPLKVPLVRLPFMVSFNHCGRPASTLDMVRHGWLGTVVVGFGVGVMG